MILVKVLGAFFAVITIGVIMRIPKKFILYAGIGGAFGWFIYLIGIHFSVSELFSNFLATLGVAFTSHVFARVFKGPVTIFLIPGIVPLVPGTGMYRIVYSLIQNENSKANVYFSQTLQTAGAIALGIFIMDTAFRFYRKR